MVTSNCCVETAAQSLIPNALCRNFVTVVNSHFLLFPYSNSHSSSLPCSRITPCPFPFRRDFHGRNGNPQCPFPMHTSSARVPDRAGCRRSDAKKYRSRSRRFFPAQYHRDSHIRRVRYSPSRDRPRDHTSSMCPAILPLLTLCLPHMHYITAVTAMFAARLNYTVHNAMSTTRGCTGVFDSYVHEIIKIDVHVAAAAEATAAV